MRIRMTMPVLGALAICLALLLTPATGHCKWPTSQLNVVIPFSPGGTTDRVARAMGPFLEKELGVPVVMINRKGGGSIVGTKAHLKNDPSNGSFIVYTIEPYLSGATFKGAFKLDDFDYLGENYFSPQGLWVHRDSKYKTAKQLFEAIKAKPGKVTMSVVPNSWSRVCAALIKGRLGAGTRDIPYHGGGKMRMAVIKKDVVCTITEVYGTMAAAAADMKCLAIFGNKRLPELPDVPTMNEIMKEMGLKSVPAASNFRFFMVKKGFKEKYPDRWDMLVKALAKACQNPEYQALMKKQKLVITWSGPKETTKEIYESNKVLQVFAHFWKGKKK